MAARQAPSSRLLSLAKHRAKKRGIPFDLLIEDVEIPRFCPVLGIPLFHNRGGGQQGPSSPTLDRIQPDLGYVRGNVRVISARANSIKSDATPRELLQVACFYMEND